MTGYLMVRAHFAQRWLVNGAVPLSDGAARMESAAAGWIQGTGYVAFELRAYTGCMAKDL